MDFIPDSQYTPSPFYDERPEDACISLLVIHNISLPAGQYGTGDIRRLFTGTIDINAHPSYSDLKNVKVSAHCVIYRDGQVEQFVPLSARAWHAGLSVFQGRNKCNDYAIGIEMEGCDNEPFTAEQYQALQRVTQFILDTHPAITIGRITGHSDIAPGRKTDPGEYFDWCRLRTGLSFEATKQQ
ncbi:MAG: 1,6-anhydro-N-acetylmuramyl-L-alanine amidase AmpD [Pseudomonadota bacterium]|nr:1,6-anhydro-N-acetylmuramyl-L-alanine amidase AmpD [Pseudomonadota bacterium]